MAEKLYIEQICFKFLNDDDYDSKEKDINKQHQQIKYVRRQ